MIPWRIAEGEIVAARGRNKTPDVIGLESLTDWNQVGL
jgi:hypothetical protein